MAVKSHINRVLAATADLEKLTKKCSVNLKDGASLKLRKTAIFPTVVGNSFTMWIFTERIWIFHIFFLC